MVTKLSNLLENGVVERNFSMKASDGTGLSRTFRAGTFVRGNIVSDIAETTVTVADNDTSYIYLDTDTLLITHSTTFPVEDFVMIAEFVAVTGTITTINEWRSRSNGLKDLDV